VAWIRKKGNRWLVHWRENGKKRAKSFVNEIDARLFKEDIEGGGTPHSLEELEYLAEHNLLPKGETRPAIDPEMSLEQYLHRMIDADKDLRDTTRALYLRNLRLHIEGTQLGRTDVRDITSTTLTRWWTEMSAGPGARRNAHQLVSKALNDAVVAEHIEVNPLKRAPQVKRPRRERQEEVEPLTVAQIETLADAALRPRKGQTGTLAEMARWRDRLEILIMGFAGLRAGEVGGLRVQDAHQNEDACELRLEQQVVRETGKPAYTSRLKTKAARRRVAIPCSLMEELHQFCVAHPPAADGRIFHGPNGEMRAHNDVNHAVVSAGKRIGADVNAHQLRHSAISILIEQGANVKSIQSFVGHSTSRETLDTYGHLFDQGGQALADIMEGLRETHRNRDA
jgi:integrase